eukprot:Clim_evm9s19 gene=Clim_evmTU9s19
MKWLPANLRHLLRSGSGVHQYRLMPVVRPCRSYAAQPTQIISPVLPGGILAPTVAQITDDDRAKSRAEQEDYGVRIRDMRSRVAEGGGPKARQRVMKQGKLPARERVFRVLDEGSPFLEFNEFAAHGMYEELGAKGKYKKMCAEAEAKGEPKPPPMNQQWVPAAGMVIGIGKVGGRWTQVLANDPSVKGGTYFPVTSWKHVRAMYRSLGLGIPIVFLVDSGGGYLPLQSGAFADKDHFGRIFYLQCQLSKAGVPQIACVLGSSTAGGAYVPTMSDECVIVRNVGTVFLAGPPLVQAATGEKVSAEDLGGGMMHTTTSGVIDHLAESEEDALAMVRQMVSHFGPNAPGEADVPAMYGSSESSTAVEGGVATTFEEPAYPASELASLAPHQTQTALDVRAIAARILDGSRLHEYKERYGCQRLVCGFGRIGGRLVGMMGNQCPWLDTSSMLKGAQFLELCEQRQLPVVSVMFSVADREAAADTQRRWNEFENTAGDDRPLTVDRTTLDEAVKLPKAAAALMTARSVLTVPQFTIMAGAPPKHAGVPVENANDSDTATVPSFTGGDFGEIVTLNGLGGLTVNPDAVLQWPFDVEGRDVATFATDADDPLFWASAHLRTDMVVLPEETRENLIHLLNIAASGRARRGPGTMVDKAAIMPDDPPMYSGVKRF